jgi:hypothetical protein
MFFVSSAALRIKFGKTGILVMEGKISSPGAYPAYLFCHR